MRYGVVLGMSVVWSSLRYCCAWRELLFVKPLPDYDGAQCKIVAAELVEIGESLDLNLQRSYSPYMMYVVAWQREGELWY